MKKITYISLLLLFILPCALQAQQIDVILKQKPFKVSGGLGVNQNLYFANQIQDRFVPYSFIVSGNVNFSIYGVSLPFSFNYSSQKIGYTTPQPFNIIGVSPSYKKLTLHAGYRNMTFSPYTLAGHSYLGGGLEYKGSKFNIMTMAGRLLRASSGEKFNQALQNTKALPNYSRVGGGVKLGYNNKGTELGLVTFYAKDLENSLKILTDSVNIRSEENQVYSLSLKKPLTEKININFEGALSGWTKNSQSDKREIDKLYEYAFFLPLKLSTVFYSAIKTGLDVAFNKSKIGVNFERVEPEYRTLGAYYINNDFQNITMTLSRPLLKNKVNFSANGGLQKDDLLNQKQTKMKRVVLSTNLSVKWSEKVNTTLGFSNFNNYINVKPVDRALLQNSPYDQIDTLNFVQINQNASIGNQWKILENDNVGHNLSINGNYARSSNNNSGEKIANNMANGGMSYGLNLKKTATNLTLSLNSNQNFFPAGTSSFYGSSVGLSQSFFKKKLNASLSLQGNTNYEAQKRVALLYGINNSYTTNIGKKHAVSLNMRYSGRKAKANSQLSNYNTTFNEFTGTLSYNFKF